MDVSKGLAAMRRYRPIHALGRRVKAGFALLRWNLRSLWRLGGARGPADRRLLLIYDFSSQPFSIDDILVMHQASLVLRAAGGLDRVDMALVYDQIGRAHV